MEWQLKLKAGKYMRPVTITREGERLFLKFPFNRALLEEVRAMQGARWHGYDEVKPRKCWSIADTSRNRFQLAYLAHPSTDDPENPYHRYEQPLVEYRSSRRPYAHQQLMTRAGLTYHYCIWAAEMGCVAGSALVPVCYEGASSTVTLQQLYSNWTAGWRFHDVRIKSLCDGRMRLNPIRDVLHKGLKSVLRLTTAWGRSVLLTSDHEVCVTADASTFEPVSKLRPGDTIYVYGELEDSGQRDPLPWGDEVLSVEEAGMTDVFDVICAEPHRNFVADGVIVHNCGKTLSAIELMEQSGVDDWLWVGPRSALYSVQLEFRKWGALLRPKFFTYEAMKKLVEDWPSDRPAPRGLIIDECSRCKNPSAQRTQAVDHLAESIRKEHGDRGYVVEMSGSPAPKSPADWWSLCEIACPGFIREGSLEKFKRRLAIIEDQESLAGGRFPKLVTWKDDPKKCDVCGMLREHERHDAKYMAMEGGDYHPFKPSVDEVSYLYKRMRGLVHVFFKRDCLDLPDKVYRIIECRPSQSVLNAARAIAAKAPSTIQGLTLLRELSDGFQYSEEESGSKVCDRCRGSRIIQEQYDVNAPDDYPTPEELERGHRITEDGDRGPDIQLGQREVACSRCSGTGSIASTTRVATQVPCPKEDALRDVLDEHDEVGRLVIFAGFTGSVDRCVSTVVKAGWMYVRVDGRGWHSNLAGDPVELISTFQEGQTIYPRVAFVMQPSSGGMGLNLTASPTVLYYSNDFNAESRLQSEDRCHRPGMDLNRGCTIIDLIHLPTDLQVLENLRQKRKLQDMTMGAFKDALDQAVLEARVL